MVVNLEELDIFVPNGIIYEIRSYYIMNTIQQTDIQELMKNHEMEYYPLTDIAIGSINKIIQNSAISRERKVRLIIEFNLSFSIVYHCLLSSKKTGKIKDIDYTFILLQLVSWYRVYSAAS